VPLMIGQSIVVLDETLMSVFGDLVGDGAQTQLQYARRTMLLPVGVIAQAAGVAAYPFLARLFAARRLEEMADGVDRALRWVLALSIGAAALAAATTVPTIRVLFERFEFTAADTAATANGLFFLALAIPVWGGLQIITRAFYARADMWTPVLVGTAATVVAVPLYWGFQAGFGLRGVAAASLLALSAYTAALLAIWYRRPEHAGRWRRVLDSAGRALLASFAGGLTAFVLSSGVLAVLGDGFIAAALALVVATVGFAGAAIGAALGIAAMSERVPRIDSNGAES
jgi:putative peptidoglycan lipid II flippase